MGDPPFDPAWALRPEGLGLVASLAAGGRRRIVECGSGLSTIAIARALSGLGDGHSYALEHSPNWAEVTREALAADGLEAFATVIAAPLVDGWYDAATLDRLPGDGIDLLLVDGPPAGEPGTEHSRYPALPTLADRLAPNAVIVLDDADRDGERWVLERWVAEFPLEPLPGPLGMAVALYVPAHGRDRLHNEGEGRNERNS